MARSEESRVKVWQDRIRSANKAYDKWAELYQTHRLEEYYLGRQWRGRTEPEAQELYAINLVFATIETNKPTLLFGNPKIKISPRPGMQGTAGSESDLRAKLCQDTVQTFIDDPKIGFAGHTQLALHESHFRFGVIEVGYTADFIDNPNAGQPVLKEEDDTPIKDDSGNTLEQPERLPVSEALYVKRIPASAYRTSMSSCNRLTDNDWVAYSEWHYVEDIKDNKTYRNTVNLKATGQIDRQLTSDRDIDDDERERRHGMVKIWKIWDLRKKKKHVIAEGHKKFLMEDVGFTFLPHAAMKWYEILDSFYPLPPVYNWLMPQDEINETREAQRAHRRRFYRRYTAQKGSVDKEEMDKLENGGDGAFAWTNVPDPIKPIQDAPMGSDVWANLDASKEDFLNVSGVGDDQRGVANTETATQANIIDTRNKLRESAIRKKVGEWLGEVAHLMLLTITESMALPFWIKRNVDLHAVQTEAQQQEQQLLQLQQQTAMTGQPPMDPATGMPVDPQMLMMPGPAAMDVMVTSHLYEEITSEDLEDVDVDVSVELATMSPVTQDVERANWNNVLALLVNPQLVAIFAQSEMILRKTLSLYNITAENEIREFQQLCIAAMQAIAAQQAMQAQATAEGEARTTAKKAGVNKDLVDTTPNRPMPQPPGVM